MTNTLSISGTLYKKKNSVNELEKTISISQDFTEYAEQRIAVAASGSESINLCGISSPKLIYVETDHALTMKCYRGASVISSAIPINSSLLISGNAATRYGTVTLSNAGASNADVEIFMCN